MGLIPVGGSTKRYTLGIEMERGPMTMGVTSDVGDREVGMHEVACDDMIGNLDGPCEAVTLSPTLLVQKSEKNTSDPWADQSGRLGNAVVAHHTTAMSVVQNPTKCFGKSVTGVDDTGTMMAGNVDTFPFLNRKPLDVDVSCTGSRFALVDHGNGGFIVDMHGSWFRLSVS